ncbi:MAG: hypothetical protein AAFQ37_14360 [Bacteroidota bacterium]
MSLEERIASYLYNFLGKNEREEFEREMALDAKLQKEVETMRELMSRTPTTPEPKTMKKLQELAAEHSE